MRKAILNGATQGIIVALSFLGWLVIPSLLFGRNQEILSLVVFLCVVSAALVAGGGILGFIGYAWEKYWLKGG